MAPEDLARSRMRAAGWPEDAIARIVELASDNDRLTTRCARAEQALAESRRLQQRLRAELLGIHAAVADALAVAQHVGALRGEP